MAGTDFFRKNLAVLQANYPRLVLQPELAEKTGPVEDGTAVIRVEPAASGDPTLTVDGIHVHSNRDPRREGCRQAEAALAENRGADGGAIIVLGFGLGYAAEAAAELAANHPLIILEKRPEIFRAALKNRNLEGLFSAGTPIVILGGDSGGITGALSLLEQAGIRDKPAVIKNRALMSVAGEDAEWYAGAERRIRAWASKDEINAATLRKFGRRWTKNLAVNLDAIRDIPGVKTLAGCLAGTGIPVFLAAAGPSLDKTGPCLKAIHERCILVTADTSLRFLLFEGVEPDFTVAVDPQFWNARHFQHLPCRSRSCLIAESAVYPPVLRDFTTGPDRPRALLCRSLFPLGRFVEDRTDPKGTLGAGGSVATTAWDFARLLAPAAIWIAGLDLAFPGRRTHFRGALFEENAHAESCRLAPVETRSQQALEGGFPFFAPSASGGRALTDRRLSLYGTWFENRLGQEQAVASYSLSPDGLAINGLIGAEIGALLTLKPRRDEINGLLREAFDKTGVEFSDPEERNARERRYADALRDLTDGLETIRDEAQKGSRSLDSGPNREKLLVKLDKINAAIAQSPVKEAAGFLFPPAAELEKKLRGNATADSADPWRRHLEFSALFYRELAESADYTLNLLKKQAAGIRSPAALF